ncbi:MAG: hypothetical protein QOF76_3239 [Solirubrobacteraceae bacterium]|jgi:hypothetical protein|nr:hypothetical protein [Solirubrobacteraceae bacterium]
MRRGAAWAAATVLVVLAARSLAYAVEPSPLARELQRSAGGPALWTTALAALAAGAAIAAALVWLAAIGVAEQRRLERRRVLAAPGRPRIGRLLARTGGLSLAAAAGFAVLESTLHWRAGLGWHGISCLTGPVHRDAIPIIVALSLVAAAGAAAAEHVTGWMRRTLARLAAVVRLPRLPAAVAAPSLRPLVGSFAPFGARGPPVAAR